MRIPLSRRRRQDDRGAVAILTAMLSVVLIGVLAFVTDFGFAYANKRALQNGADAAALAVAQQIAVTGSPTSTCSDLVTTWSSAGRLSAEKYFNVNRPSSTAAVAPGSSGFELSCINNGAMLQVKVAGEQTSPAFFGGLFGATGLPLRQEAKAVVAAASSVIGLRPFALCMGEALNVIRNPTANQTLVLDNSLNACGMASGNWGLLDYNGGSNPTGESEDWIRNGYNGPIGTDTPVFIPGDPGAPSPGAFEDAMNWLLDEEMVVPVYDTLSGNGNNAQFRVMGFLSVKLCGWRFQNKSGEGVCYPGSVIPASDPNNYLVLRYNGYIPLGDISKTCVLGATACDLGTRMFKLAD